eukprot:g6160.t1
MLRCLLKLRHQTPLRGQLILNGSYTPYHRSNETISANLSNKSWNTTWTGGLFRRKICSSSPVLYKGPKYRGYNEDRELAVGSSDDADRAPRKYVFVSDDDERLFDEEFEDSDSETFDDETLTDEIWKQTNTLEPVEVLEDPESHFEEWKRLAEASVKTETRGLIWAETALQATRSILTRAPLDQLTLHSFNVDVVRRQLKICLDKFLDPYGSPSVEEISIFSELLKEELEERLGAATVVSLEYEVSSPGAERQVRIPFELKRFHHLPMKVIYQKEEEVSITQTSILEFLDFDDKNGLAKWRFWKGRYNKRVLKLKKSEFTKVIDIDLKSVTRINLFVDV